MLHQNSASKIVSKPVLAKTFDLSQGDYTDKQIYNRLLIVPSKKILRTRLREYIILTCQDFIKCFFSTPKRQILRTVLSKILAFGVFQQNTPKF